MQVRKPEEGEIQRQLVTPGWHLAVCVDVLDAELKTGPKGGNTTRSGSSSSSTPP